MFAYILETKTYFQLVFIRNTYSMKKNTVRKILLLIVLISNFSVSQAQILSTRNLNFQLLFAKNKLENGGCYRIPAIVKANNGDLIVAIDERNLNCGDLKYNGNIDIVIKRSHDNGKTWSSREMVVDFPEGESASDPSIIVSPKTGELLLFYNYMNLKTEKDIYKQHVVSSYDHGKTWGKPRDITGQININGHEKDFKFITSGAGVSTRNGVLLNTLVNLDKGLFVIKSTNDGKDWSILPTPIKPADESKIIELSDGTWMINSRVVKGGQRYVHLSKDEGKSWISKVENQLNDPSCNADLISVSRKNENEILIFSHLDHKSERKNLVVRYSTDFGITWSKSIVIYSGSAAYSDLIEMENGEIGLVFEKDDYSEIVFCQFPISWLLDQ
jgi:sialidase-1